MSGRMKFALIAVIALVGVAARPASASGRVWTIMPTPSPGTGDALLRGVGGDGGRGVWAVGDRSVALGTRPLIEHRTGGRWSVVPGAPLGFADTSGEAGLNDVVALAPNDAWAVGRILDNATGGDNVLIEHWNGTRWMRDPASSPGQLQSITRVPGTYHLWSVGSQSDTQNVAGYWNGSRWRFMSLPAPGIARSFLFGVAAVSEKDVWAVGYAPSYYPGGGFAEHWSGTTWRRVPIPQDKRGDTGQLQDLANVPNTSQVWAVWS